MELTNWGGNYRFGARDLHRPASLEELQEIVTVTPQLRVVGSLHSFTDIADAAALLAVDRLPEELSVDTRWAAEAGRVWVKSRRDAPGGPSPPALFGAAAARREHHPIEGLDPVNCTPQLGRPGPWLERLPHFRMGFTPSSGEEIQS